jgi:type II secretory pathway component PulF
VGDEVGPEMLREQELRQDVRRFKMVSIIAAVVCAPLIWNHLTLTTFVAQPVAEMYSQLGGELPLSTRFLLSLSNNGVISVILIIFDVTIFILMYELAKRYWIGLLFAPVFIYMVLSSILISFLYLPMFSVITLVR